MPTTPPSAESGCATEYTVSSDWGTGFVADKADRHRTAGVRVLDRILDQVPDHAHQLITAPEDVYCICDVYIDGDTPSSRHRPHALDHLIGDTRQVDRSDRLDRRLLDSTQVEQAFDDCRSTQ